MVLVFGNKAGMKFMLQQFWHEVAPALDGMAGTLGCTELCWVRSEEAWLRVCMAVTYALVL